MKKLIFLILVIILASFGLGTASATEMVDEVLQKDGLYISDTTVQRLQDIYRENGYEDYKKMPEDKQPRIYLRQLPSDFQEMSDKEAQKILFIKMMIPLALKINEEIMIEREQILAIELDFKKNHDLTPLQNQFIEEKATKYNLFTRLKGTYRQDYILKGLLDRVDEIPPSLLIGIAIIETDYGNSRVAKLGNSLYKELVWFSQEGLEPQGETEDKTYKIKQYPSLYEAMKSFSLKLNSDINYSHMWSLRWQYRYRENPVLGRSTAHTMSLNSPLNNYAGLLDYTVTFYTLDIIDNAKLQNKIN